MAYTSSYETETLSYMQAGASLTDETSSSSVTVAATLEMSSPDDSEGLSAAIGGEAIASGEDTLTQGSVSATMVDGGVVTSADLSATMTAVAETPDGETAFASADTFADVSDGADIVFTLQKEIDSSETDEAGSTATATSTIDVVSFDISALDGEILEPEIAPPAEVVAAEAYAPPAEEELDGNFATLEFEATAIGEDSLVAADVFVIAIEDELSMSAAFIELAVE